VRGITLVTILVLALVQGCSDNLCEDHQGSSDKGDAGYHACARECQGKNSKAECSCSSRCPAGESRNVRSLKSV